MEKYIIRGLHCYYIDEPLKVVYRKKVDNYDLAIKVGEELAKMISDVYGKSYVEIIEEDDFGREVIKEISGDYCPNKILDKTKLNEIINTFKK